MIDIIEGKPGQKMLLLGNEAIVRGALEAGVDIVTTYPGTPSSEIADTFSKIAIECKKKGIEPGYYFEYSTNEKVAVEISAAGALSGLRAFTCMKHVGLNVAADAFMTYLYVGCKGGHVIVSADDPSCHSSQNEQDNRYYALFSGAPMLEPATPMEAKDMTFIGYKISEQLELPVLIRTTTRVNHTRGIVIFGEMNKRRDKKIGKLVKNPMEMVTIPANARVRHKVLIEKLKKAKTISEKTKLNYIIECNGETSSNRKIGIITSGISYSHVREVVNAFQLNVKILKLGMTHPIPSKLCEEFINEIDELIVVEELEPYIEQQVKVIAFDTNRNIKIYGKTNGYFPQYHEYTIDILKSVFSNIFKLKYETPTNKINIKLPRRAPILCPGCPHRATYYAFQQAMKKTKDKEFIFATDIGCYTLGIEPPYNMADVLLCMGSSIGTACGFSKSTTQIPVAFIGDSTFFHTGIPPLIDMAHHDHRAIVVIMDNRTTGMTGHQPHPGTETDGMGNPAKVIDTEKIVRGIGIEHVEMINPENINETIDAFTRAIEHDGVYVIISKSPCILLKNRELRKQNVEIPIYAIDEEKCIRCKICIEQFACPAFYKDNGDNEKIKINESMCAGCGVCVNICPAKAIKIK